MHYALIETAVCRCGQRCARPSSKLPTGPADLLHSVPFARAVCFAASPIHNVFIIALI